MKPLFDTQITRDRQEVGDWIKSEDHLTVDGLEAFKRRQLDRIARIQRKPEAKVTELKRGKNG